MRALMRVVTLALAPVLFGAAQPALADFERAELEQMLAPIALYPDSVLSHVLIAATYPDQVWEAARWSRRHPDLEGEAAVDAVEDFGWDPSVKALVAFPDILARMDEDPDWTERLGDAFLDQEGEVMDSVQTLRDRAYDAGRLDSLEYVRVVREREYIYIEPAVRTVVYIPYYDPWYVYGSWWWPSYPPYCWRTWRGHPAAYYPHGFHWGVGFRIEPTFYFTSFYWPQRHVVVAQPRPNWRPLYSGRDVVVRHEEVRHWREERGRAVRVQRRSPGSEARAPHDNTPDPRRERPRSRAERREDDRAPRAAPGDARRAQPRPRDDDRDEGRRDRQVNDERGRGRGEARPSDGRRPDRGDDRPGDGARRDQGPSERSAAEPRRSIERPATPARESRRDEVDRGPRPQPHPRSAPESREPPADAADRRGPRVSRQPEGRERAAERRERERQQPRGRDRSARER